MFGVCTFLGGWVFAASKSSIRATSRANSNHAPNEFFARTREQSVGRTEGLVEVGLNVQNRALLHLASLPLRTTTLSRGGLRRPVTIPQPHNVPIGLSKRPAEKRRGVGMTASWGKWRYRGVARIANKVVVRGPKRHYQNLPSIPQPQSGGFV
jgi:hypothetical protein